MFVSNRSMICFFSFDETLGTGTAGGVMPAGPTPPTASLAPAVGVVSGVVPAGVVGVVVAVIVAVADLRGAIPELRGAMIATVDGLPIAQLFTDNTDGNRVAAMAATALGLGKRINDTLGTGDLSEMSVAGLDGQVYIYAAGRKGVLAVVAPSGMNVGLLNMEARDAASRVTQVL